MTRYRFSLLATDRRTHSSCIIDADDDEEVREIADDLIRESVFHTVEVWSGTRRVYQVAKSDVASFALN